jgi:hypothetical protein
MKPTHIPRRAAVANWELIAVIVACLFILAGEAMAIGWFLRWWRELWS